jgi:hypothetical protein
MLRTLAIFLLLLGLATATPIVCLCAPPLAAGIAAVTHDEAFMAAGTQPLLPASGVSADTARLISSSAAAAVASIVATAAGLPSSAPWRLPRPGVVTRLLPLAQSTLAGLAWSPAVPPPR